MDNAGDTIEPLYQTYLEVSNTAPAATTDLDRHWANACRQTIR